MFSLIRVALIDLRGGFGSLWILVACIALGVASVTVVSSVGESLQSALTRDARLLLGGDIEIRLTHRPADADERAFFADLGKVSEVIDLMGRAQSQDGSVLAAVRAVDAAYPLRGVVEVDGEGSLERQLGSRSGVRGAVADPRLLDRLGIAIGDRIQLGKAEFEIRGILHSVPDQVSQGVAIGYPLLISTDGLADTEIVQPGGLARYRYKIDLAVGTDAALAVKAVQEAFPDVGLRISQPGDATEELSRYFELLRRFLTVVSLSALLVGGLGVAHAVSAYITERQRSIATMKALGAESNRVLLHFLIQVLILTLVGITLGLALSLTSTVALLPRIGPMIGMGLMPIIDGPSIAASVAFGLLTSFLFAYLPLTRVEAMRPAQLFRSTVSSSGKAMHLRVLLQPRVLLPMLGALTGLIAVAIFDTGWPEIVFWYAVGASVAFAVLRGASQVLQRGLRLVPPAPNALIRNAVKSIHRAGSPASAVILSLGLGISLLLLIALSESNLRHQLDPEARIDAPDLIYMDLFADEVEAFQALSATDARIASFTAIPLVRASSLTINGHAPPEIKEPPKDLTIYFGDEQPLTYAVAIPEGSRVVSGDWWPAEYAGPPLVSVSQDMRSLLGLELGDEITFLIFGDPVSTRIANFRAYDWQRGGVNFPYVLSPGALDGYQSSYFGLFKAKEGTIQSLQSGLAASYPELVFLPIEEAIDAVRGLMTTVSTTISIVGAIALASGLLVLIGVLATGRRQREADSIVAKVLGATRADLIASFLVEYVLVGGIAALLAVGLGVAGAWAFVTIVLQFGFSADPVLLALVAPLAMLLTVGVGAIITWNTLSRTPASYLRQG
ncbi:ABC transporter permease [Devosia sp. SL43]|uniref:ABC transporter permease n=1 Tax=Devosia sp. SL43 TaxID=2806348 RepID=UPI001F2A7F3D|nr:FtsX-like permease family protein [Devosia sp. SL43]UJW87284.1 ABC transporter permease [Devosia sp. SL43]